MSSFIPRAARPLALLLGLALGLLGAPARAGAEILTLRPIAIADRYYEVSAVYGLEAYDVGGLKPFRLSGIHVSERNGVVGKMLVYVSTQLLLAVGQGAAQSQGKHVGTSYGPGYRVDYYRSYSSSEIADMNRARESAGESTLESEFQMDLQIFFPNEKLGTTTRGFRWEIAPLQFSTGVDKDSRIDLGFELGFAWERLRDEVTVPVAKGTGTNGRDFKARQMHFFGSPLRGLLHTRFVNVMLEWRLNWLNGLWASNKRVFDDYQKSLGDSEYEYASIRNSPINLRVSANPIDWVFVQATASLNRYRLSPDNLGYQLEAGLRF